MCGHLGTLGAGAVVCVWAKWLLQVFRSEEARSEHQCVIPVWSGGQAGEVGSYLVTKGLRPVVKKVGPHPRATSNIGLEE